MTERSAKRLFPNPFYVVLLLASTLFVLTIFGYLIAPTVQDQAANRPGGARGAQNLAAWLNRHSPLALGIELVVMVAAAFLAMATDRWFPERPAEKQPPSSGV